VRLAPDRCASLLSEDAIESVRVDAVALPGEAELIIIISMTRIA
jgi:hypothetical protein